MNESRLEALELNRQAATKYENLEDNHIQKTKL